MLRRLSDLLTERRSEREAAGFRELAGRRYVNPSPSDRESRAGSLRSEGRSTSRLEANSGCPPAGVDRRPL